MNERREKAKKNAKERKNSKKRKKKRKEIEKTSKPEKEINEEIRVRKMKEKLKERKDVRETRPDTRHKMRLVCVLSTFENNTGRTYGPTDRRTDTTSYGDATAHLKMEDRKIMGKMKEKK